MKSRMCLQLLFKNFIVIDNKLKTNDKTQISSEENKTKKSEVSESTAKRLAYGVLAAVAILVSIPILLLLLIPAQ